VASDLSRSDVKEEVGVGVGENLLIEAVSLLVQRQHETESWVAEQVSQAEERAAVSERRYGELEARLVGIEDQLERLMREVEPGRSAAVDERLVRLREQLEGLKSGADGRPARAVPAPSLPTLEATPAPPPREPEPPTPHTPLTREPEPSTYRAALLREPVPPKPASLRAAAADGQSAGFWDLLGSTAESRFGIALIGVGAIAVLFAILTQLPLR
jgi:hypothetical protein